MGEVEDFITALKQTASAMGSGSLSRGPFPWELSKMTESSVRGEYGTTGVQTLKDYRRASEDGKEALAAFREGQVDPMQRLNSEDCRELNNSVETGKLTFADVHEQYGDRGLHSLEKYRVRHFYEPGAISGDRYDPAKVQNLDSFRAQSKPPAVIYHHANEHDEVRPPAFVDHGNRVQINEAKSHDVVASALELSAHKWNGQFQVSGSNEYKAMCVQIAAEHGYNITNPELQTALNAAKKDLAATKSEKTGVSQGPMVAEQEKSAAVMPSVAVPLSEEYAQLLITNAYPGSIRAQSQSMYDVAVLEQPFELKKLGLDGVQLLYSEEHNQFYASMEPDRKPALEKTLGRLVSEQRAKTQQKPDIEVERE